MHRKDRWIGLFLGAVVAVWGTAGAVGAKPPASHTNHGHANGHASSHAVSHGSAKHQSSTTQSSASHGSSAQKQTAATHSGSSATKSSGSNGSSPPGNNGTVKIDNYSDRNGNDTAHNNEPHV